MGINTDESASEILRYVVAHGCPMTLGGPPSHAQLHNAVAELLDMPDRVSGSDRLDPAAHRALHEMAAHEILRRTTDINPPPPMEESGDLGEWHHQRHEWEAVAVKYFLRG